MTLASMGHIALSGTSCSLAEAGLVGDGVMAKSTANCIKKCRWSLAVHGSGSGSAYRDPICFVSWLLKRCVLVGKLLRVLGLNSSLLDDARSSDDISSSSSSLLRACQGSLFPVGLGCVSGDFCFSCVSAEANCSLGRGLNLSYPGEHTQEYDS